MTRTIAIGGLLFMFASIHAQMQSAAGQPKSSARTPRITPQSDCSPSASQLRTLAGDLYAKNPDPNDFIRALDAAVGISPTSSVLDRALLISYSEELSVIAFWPYDTFRTSLLEAIRKKEPISTGIVPLGVRIVVSPSRIDAPDIEKIVVERDGKTISPIATTLRSTELATRLGAKRMIHAGEVTYACSAFAPGAFVTVTAIPTAGENLVKIVADETLTKLK